VISAALYSCWPLAAALILVCGCLAVVARRMKPEQRRSIFQLHADERGSVQSLSFVITAPIFIMLMMLAVQITQLMIGEIIVNYAAFSAARSASVYIPARIERPMIELENWLNLRQMAGHEFDTSITFSPKICAIHRAAALACLPIAPSRDLGKGDITETVTQAIISAFNAYSSSGQSNKRLPKRLANKWAYALEATAVEVSTFHRRFGTSQSSYQNEPPLWDSNPLNIEAYYKPTEVGWRDEITVKVTHNFALLPGPGRLLARTTGTDPNSAANRIQTRSGVYYVPISASATMVPEGEKSIAPYIHQPYWP
jgi:hypothetical protein